jgi:hypothetical protein
VLQLLITANVVPSSLLLFTLKTEVKHSSVRSVLTRAIRHHISEDGILHMETITILVIFKNLPFV